MTRRLFLTIFAALALLLTAHQPADAAAAITVKLSPATITNGAKSTVSVVLPEALKSSATLSIKLSDSSYLKAPESVKIASGKRSASFKVTAGEVDADTKVTIYVSGDMGEAKATLKIVPLRVASLSIAPTSVVGGSTAKGTVRLNGPALGDGAKVEVSVDGSAKVEGSVLVKAGKTSATFSIYTGNVDAASKAKVTVGFQGSKASATLNIVPLKVTAVSVSPKTIMSGAEGTGTVKLNGAAPEEGAKVEIWVDGPGKTEGSVYIEPGASSVTFTVYTGNVDESTKATLGAAFRDLKVTSTFTIAPLQISSLAVSEDTVISGGTTTGTVTLNSAAPEGGIKAEVWTDGPAKTEGVAYIGGGQTSGSFTIWTGNVDTATTVTVGAAFSNSKLTTTFTLAPLQAISVTVSPKTIAANGTATGTVKLNGPAPEEGITVKVWSEGGAKTDGEAYVKGGRSSGTFTVYASDVSESTTATVGAYYNGEKLTTSVKIVPVQVKSVTTSESVTSGGKLKVTITLTVATPNDIKVGIKTSDGNVIPLPDAIVINAGSSTASVTITVGKVKESSTYEIVVFGDNSKAGTTVVVNPAG